MNFFPTAIYVSTGEQMVHKIAAAEPSAMKLIELKEQTTAVVDALNISHQNDIGTPIALYVKDDG